MYILPVNQPYADLIIKGYKHFETRPTRTKIRGMIAIYACKERVTPFVKSLVFGIEPDKPDIKKWFECCDTKNYGVIVGTCEITDVLTTKEVRCLVTDFEDLCGDYSSGRYAYQITNPVMFDTPIPYKAHQGWNKVDDTATEVAMEWDRMLKGV